MLLRSDTVRVSPNCSVYPLVGSHIVVLPDSNDLVIVCLPAPYKPSAMTDLNRQEVVGKEVVEGSKLFRHCDVTTNAVEHRRTIDGQRL